MKKSILILLLCLTNVVYVMAQDVNKNGFEYEEVVPSDQSKAILWINLKKWVSSNFSSYQHVVDMEDKDAGIMIIKWNSGQESPSSSYWTVQYNATYQIDVRENKYRIKIYNSNAHVKPNIGNVKTMSTSSLRLAQDELKKVIGISEALQGSETWSLDNKYLEVMEYNSAYYETMHSVKLGFDLFNSMILNSLKTSMVNKDDF